MIDERALLEAFVVENRDLEQLEALLAEFNIFEAMGAVRQELRHSDLLAFLMDPAQNHGLGAAFLKRFLKRVLTRAGRAPVSVIDIDVAEMQAAEVLREWRKIDILIHDRENRFLCAIENKIGSRERPGQLSAYRAVVSREFPDYRAVFVYLTPEGDAPSHEDYIPLSYGEIAELVDAVCGAHESTLGADVYTLMRHYTAMLRRHIVTDSEIAELCRRIYRRHKQALDLIFEYRPDLQLDISEYLRKLVEEQEDSGIAPRHSTKRYIDFSLSEWNDIPPLRSGKGSRPSGPVLLFEFQNDPDRLTLYLLIGPGPDAVRQKIHGTALQYPDIFRGALKHLYPKWTMIYKRPILRPRDYEDADFDSLAERVKRDWAKFIANDLPAIRKIVNRIEWPPVD